MNTIINSFILVPEIRNAMAKKYSLYNLEREIPLRDLLEHDDFNLKDVIFTIIGQILNTNKIPVLDNGDYIIMLAAYIKSNYVENEFNDLLQSNNIQRDNKPIYKFCSATLNNILRNELCNSPEKINELRILNRLCNYKLPNNICRSYNDLYKNKGYLFGIYGYASLGWVSFIEPIFGNVNDEIPYKSFSISDSEKIYIYNHRDIGEVD